MLTNLFYNKNLKRKSYFSKTKQNNKKKTYFQLILKTFKNIFHVFAN